MNVFPSIQQILLAIFTGLITLGGALTLYVITTKSKNLEEMKNNLGVIRANQSEIDALAKKVVTSDNEIQDAVDYLTHKFPEEIEQVKNQIQILEKEKLGIRKGQIFLVGSGLVFLLFSLLFSLIYALQGIRIFNQVVISAIDFFTLFFFGCLTLIFINFNKKIKNVQRKLEIVGAEKLKALKLVQKMK